MRKKYVSLLIKNDDYIELIAQLGACLETFVDFWLLQMLS